MDWLVFNKTITQQQNTKRVSKPDHHGFYWSRPVKTEWNESWKEPPIQSSRFNSYWEEALDSITSSLEDSGCQTLAISQVWIIFLFYFCLTVNALISHTNPQSTLVWQKDNMESTDRSKFVNPFLHSFRQILNKEKDVLFDVDAAHQWNALHDRINVYHG